MRNPVKLVKKIFQTASNASPDSTLAKMSVREVALIVHSRLIVLSNVLRVISYVRHASTLILAQNQ